MKMKKKTMYDLKEKQNNGAEEKRKEEARERKWKQ